MLLIFSEQRGRKVSIAQLMGASGYKPIDVFVYRGFLACSAIVTLIVH